MHTYNIYFFTIAAIHNVKGFIGIVKNEKTIDENASKVLYNLVNKLVITMNATKEFDQNNDLKKLLLIYGDVNRLPKNYNKMLDAIRTWSRADFFDKIVYNGINFNDIFDKAVYDDYRNKIHKQMCDVRVKTKDKNETVKGKLLNNLEQFPCKFIENIDKFMLNSSQYDSISLKTLKQFKQQYKRHKPNLKVWDSSNITVGVEGLNTRRLYKGHHTTAQKYPFIASVHVNNVFICGGSIIARCIIITAATCLRNDKALIHRPENIFVRVGSDYVSKNGQKFKVKAVFVHPGYETLTLRNNLAILKLECKLFSYEGTHRIRRIQFDSMDEQMPINSGQVIVLGWGSRHEGDENFESEPLSYSKLNSYHIRDCQSLYTEKYVTLKHFCAGFISTGGGSCNRDVGGPGIQDGVLMGVISFGSPVCGHRDAPTVFTKLGFYAKWINKIIEQDVTDGVDNDVENENEIQDLVQSYYTPDRKSKRYKPLTDRRKIRKKEYKKDIRKMIKMLPEIKRVEIPKLLRYLYGNLPTKLTDLLTKIPHEQSSGKPNEYKETFETPTRSIENRKNLVVTFLLDTKTGLEGKQTTKIVKQSITQSNDVSVKSAGEPNNSEIKDASMETSDNYESYSDDNDYVEIGMSILSNDDSTNSNLH